MKTSTDEVSPDSIANVPIATGEVIQQIQVVPFLLEENVDQEPQEFQVPADIELNESDQNLFTFLGSMLQEDIPVYYYFPAGTRAADRTFVFNTMILFSDWRSAQQYNAPAAVIDQLLASITSTAGPSNKTADIPFKQEFGSMASFCSALVYISRRRNRWPIAKRMLPKLFVRVGNCHDYFPFTG